MDYVVKQAENFGFVLLEKKQLFHLRKIVHQRLGVVERERYRRVAQKIRAFEIYDGEDTAFVALYVIALSLRQNDGVMWVGNIFVAVVDICYLTFTAKRKTVTFPVVHRFKLPFLRRDRQKVGNIRYRNFVQIEHKSSEKL